VKPLADGVVLPATNMRTIRQALARLRRLDLPLWKEGRGYSVLVDRGGHVHIDRLDGIEDIHGQRELPRDTLDLLAPFGEPDSPAGPDLRAPRPHLRIVRGKLAGEPHVQDTRVETRAIAALAARGYELREIAELYPFISVTALGEAVDLERQLASVAHAA